MSKFKGTPGPWFAVKNSVYWDIRIYNNDYGQILASTQTNRFIPINSEQEKANAQLIAAAPELLEALQDCKDTLLLCTLIDKSGQAKESFELAELVINKALGL